MGNNNKRNAEGYSDPTAYLALSKIEKEEHQLVHLKKVLGEICSLSGFRIKGQITFVEKKSGHLFRI